MSLDSIVNNIKKTRVIAIDPASHSLAWVICDFDKNFLQIIDYGKVSLLPQKEVSGKFSIINQELSNLCAKYNPDVGVIEQSVYIQNFQSSRIISYIIGFTWGVLLQSCKEVCDVGPLIWKNKIGYKNLTKIEKHNIEKVHGLKGIQAKFKNERKDRVKVILDDKIGFSLEDDDINDAIGIALWYYLSHGFGTLQRQGVAL